MQRIAAGLLAGMAMFSIVVAFAGVERDGLRWLALPAALAGAVAPVAGARAYEWLVERPGALAPERHFERTLLIVLGIGEAAAFFGLVVVLLTREPLAWIGPATFVLLCGAYWPSPARWASFERRASSARSEPADG